MTVEITQLTLKKTSINTFNLSRATNGIYRAHDFTRHISGKKFSVGFLIKWGVSSPWSFRPNNAWGSIQTMTIGKTHPALLSYYFLCWV